MKKSTSVKIINLYQAMALLRKLLSLAASLTIFFITVKAMPLEVEPQWGRWSQWSRCNRLCGAGISSQKRSCSANCKKDGTIEERFQSCCIQACPAGQGSGDNDISQNICSSLSGNWTEASTGRVGCSVRCTKQVTDPAHTAVQDIALPPGTSCHTEQGRKGLCLKNQCVVTGCDNILGSGKEEDKCHQCPSSDSPECKLITRKTSVTLPTYTRAAESVSVLRVPERSSFLNISHLLKGSGMRLAIRDNNRHTIFKGGKNGTTFQAAGTLFKYFIFSDIHGDKEELLAEGPTRTSTVIQLYGLPAETSVSETYVHYSYHHLQGASSSTLHGNATHIYNASLSMAEPNNGAIYAWKYMASSQCSVTCGRGVRTMVPACIDTAYPDRMLVDAFCLQRELEKPLPVVQLCHIQDCLPEWQSGEWSSCSGECGKGMQSRHVQCQQFVEDGRHPVLLEDEGVCDTQTKPAQERHCNATYCDYTWTTTNWSPCPEEVTEGIQYREVNCRNTSTAYTVDHTNCDAGTRPARVRNCRSRNCNNGRCCAWRPQSWEKCDVDCGIGNQSRPIECRYMDTNSRTDQTCCAGLELPVSQQQCWSVNGSGCSPFWNPGDYGECTGSCCSDNHIKTRAVNCLVSIQDRDIELPDEACPGPKPPATTTCRRNNCPKWNISEWGKCPPPNLPDCGIRTRTVLCMLDGKLADGCADCELPPLEAESCFPCGTTPSPEPPTCEGEDEFVGFCNIEHCEVSFFRRFCCATCRNQ